MSNSDETYGTFEDLIREASADLAPICTALRQLITGLQEDFYEVVWKKQNIASYGVGPKKMSEHYVYIGVHKKHVNLGFYHGAALSDPENLLQGTGKRLRHIKIKQIAEAATPAVKQLVAAAIADRKGIHS